MDSYGVGLDSRLHWRYNADMRFTRYFLHTHERPDRCDIKIEWIEQVVAKPVKVLVQADGRIRKWERFPRRVGDICAL